MSKQETGAPIATEEQHEHVHGPDCDHDHDHDHEHEAEPRIKPIDIELEELTVEGKAKAEKQLGRAIKDLPYELVSREPRPNAVTALNFTISRADYLSEQTKQLEDLREQVTLPGFRKGKAPLKLLQIRMGEDAVRSTIASLATNALRQEHIKAPFEFVAKPRIADYEVAQGAETVGFVVEVELMPNVELKQVEGLEVEVERRDVTDAQVEERIEGLRRQNSVLEPAAEGDALGEGDVLVADIEVTNERGERMGHLSRADQQLYNFKSELPEAVASQLVGKKVGETLQTVVETEVTNRRGEPVKHSDNWQVAIKEIKRTKLPELNDEFAKDLGDYADLAELRAKTRAELVKAEEDRRNSEALGKLFRVLVEKNPVDAPRSLLAHRQYELIMQDSYQMQRMGLRLEQVVRDPEAYLRDQRASAEEMVKVQLVTAQIIKREGLDVTDEDIEKEIAVVAEQSGRKPLAVRARLEAQKQMDQFRNNVARKKLGDWLMARNTVKLVEPKPAEAPTEVEATPVE